VFSRRKFFNLFLKCLGSLERDLMLVGKGLKILIPEYETPFCTSFKLVVGGCKLLV